MRIAEQDGENEEEDEEEHDEERKAAAEEEASSEGEEVEEDQEAVHSSARGVARGGDGGVGEEHERVPSTIPEEVSAPLTESASFVVDEQHALAEVDGEAEAEGRGRDDDLSTLPAYQAYLYVLLGAAVARDFLHPRTTASAVGKRNGPKTEEELAVEREHKRILQTSEVRQKGVRLLIEKSVDSLLISKHY